MHELQLNSCLADPLSLLDFPGGSVVRNLPANEGDLRVGGSIPGSGRSLEKEMATPSSILAWKIPWTEVPGKLQSMRLQRDGYDQTTTRTFSVTRAVKMHESITDSRDDTKTK